MARWRRLHLWFALALVSVVIVVEVLWLRGTLPGSARSPLPTPVVPGTSPLLTPALAVSATSTSTPAPPSSWTSGGAVLLWVTLGIVLALGLTFVMLRLYRRAT